ncbi:MAG TPA: hypothetical protein VMF06_21725 [Candidatus Limnocylindria bacterium]|jgi:hypothetical protein|nr:hypothetical protein [Candidatus Limnocylindria bacterium]
MALSCAGLAADGLGPGLELSIAGECELPPFPGIEPGALAGNYLYVSGDGLTVVDVSSPKNPQVVGHLDGPGAFGQPVVAGSLVFQIMQGRLRAIDVSNPATPHEIGAVSNVAGYYLKTMDHYAVVTGRGLYIIDIADPHRLEVTGQMPDINVPIPLAGRYGYLAKTNGIGVLDFTDPANPHLSTIVSVPPGTFSFLGQRDNWLYLRHGAANNDNNNNATELLLYNTRSPDRPVLEGTIGLSGETPLPGSQLLPVKDRFITGTGNLVSIHSASEPAGIHRLGTYSFAPASKTTLTAVLAASERYAYLETMQGFGSDMRIVMRVLDIGTPASYFPVNKFNSARVVGLSHDTALLSAWGDFDYDRTNNYFYTFDAVPPLPSVDLRNPLSEVTAPTNKPTYSDYAIRGLTPAGDRAVATFSSDTFAVYDLPEGGKPRIVSSFPIGKYGVTLLGNASALSADATTAYVGDTGNGVVWRIDISDPLHPRIINSSADMTNGPCQALTLKGRWLYTLSGKSLKTLEVSDPEGMVLRHTLDLGTAPQRVIANDTHLFVIGFPLDGFSIFSLSDPSNPKLVSSYSDGIYRTTGLVVGKYLYAGRFQYGLDVFDVSDAAAAVRVGGNSTFPATEIFTDGKIVVTSGMTFPSYRTGDSYVFPLFEDSPAYTPLAQRFSGGWFQFDLRGIPGTNARIQRANALENWTDWKQVKFGTGDVSVADEEITGSQQFYRVVAP